MTNWIKAVNPLATASTEPEAVAAARASAIAIFIGVVYGACGLLFGVNMMKAGVEAQPNAAASPEMMFQIVLGLAIAVVVIQAVLAFVQWAKPNVVIPIIFVILVGYGLVSIPLGRMMAANMGIESPAIPAWQMALSVAVLVIELVLHIAGIRGANALKRFRDAQAY